MLLDVSASMGYGSGAITKLQYGSYLAAALAYLMNRQRDAVGLIAFDDKIIEDAAGRALAAGHLTSLLVTLERLTLGDADRRRQAASTIWPRPSASAAWWC